MADVSSRKYILVQDERCVFGLFHTQPKVHFLNDGV